LDPPRPAALGTRSFVPEKNEGIAMKKLINAVDDILAESLDGFAAAHAGLVVLGDERKFVRRRTLKPGKVALISGGRIGPRTAARGFRGSRNA
jgi:dihydroxyacetone kinase-like protein